MPIRIKSAASLQQKYQQNANNASQSYTAGVQNPKRDWAAATAAAATTWQAGVSAAVASGSWAASITPDAAAKQKANAVALGANRYGPGVTNAAPTWAKNTQPILDSMAAVPDMPRGVKMSQQNFDKQHAYAQAAHDASKKG